MPSRIINLAIVDDHALFRTTLKNFLSSQKDIQVTVQASEIRDLFKQLKDASVDVLLMDVFMPELTGDEGLRIVKSEYPDIKVLMVSMCTDLGLVNEMIEGGIHGYISKADEPEELLRAIRVISENRLYRNNLLMDALCAQKRNFPKTNEDASLTRLNQQEKKILQLIWEEKSNKEIAKDLLIGVRSVENMRQGIKQKIGAKSTIGLLKYAINSSIITDIPIDNCARQGSYR